MTHADAAGHPARPHTRSRSASAKARAQARRSAVAATLVCVAAGVGGGLAVQHQQVALKDARVQRSLALPLAPVTHAVRAAAEVASTEAAQRAAQQAALEAQQGTTQASNIATPSSAELRSQLRWVTLQVGQRQVATLDANSRLLLTRTAAQKAGLTEVGLDYRDVYGVIHAESSWVARPGLGRNGVVSHGLAQFEPATARALGLRNPGDPVEAVEAAALHLKEAARWSARRIDGLKLDAGQWSTKLREGISVYYNLSTRGRKTWDGLNSNRMPVETRLHIRNVQEGALRAARLTAGDDSLGAPPDAVAATPVLAAAAPAALAAPPATVRRRALAARADAGGARVRVSFAGAPRKPQAAWIRGKDSITLPEGSIRWSSRENGSSRG